MMGSRASRGAVASVGAGRASLAAAPAIRAISAAIAASDTIAGGPRRRIAAVVNRFTMPCPVEMLAALYIDQVSGRDFWNRRHPRQFAETRHVLVASLSYTKPRA